MRERGQGGIMMMDAECFGSSLSGWRVGREMLGVGWSGAGTDCNCERSFLCTENGAK